MTTQRLLSISTAACLAAVILTGVTPATYASARETPMVAWCDSDSDCGSIDDSSTSGHSGIELPDLPIHDVIPVPIPIPIPDPGSFPAPNSEPIPVPIPVPHPNPAPAPSPEQKGQKPQPEVPRQEAPQPEERQPERPPPEPANPRKGSEQRSDPEPEAERERTPQSPTESAAPPPSIDTDRNQGADRVTPAPAPESEAAPAPPDSPAPPPPPSTADVETKAVVTDFRAWLLFAAALAGTFLMVRVARAYQQYRSRGEPATRFETRLGTAPFVVDMPEGPLPTRSIHLELRISNQEES
ncbi:hypothetical protein L618_002300000530 [Rhodococcus rhodochrous J45]|uniref:Uncharacterized protein n=1 Tax=Rhodococcus rhodochrous J45 TaxID=935266 RepID=A0A562E420_RHORH|nr:hypothetical protein L618_002300000530 [Rhodococcus rhodochrous J45]